MKIGNLDIKKAFLGSIPLTSKNAYIGNYKMIDGGDGIPLKFVRATSSGEMISIPTPTYSTGSKFIAKFKVSATGGEAFMGGPPPTTGAEDNTDLRIFFARGTTFYYDAGSARWTSSTIKMNTIYELEFGSFYIKNLVTGSNIMSQTQTGSYSLNKFNIFHFGKSGGGTGGNDIGDVYYVKLYDQSGKLILDLIPWQDTKGWCGFKNLVDGNIYTSSKLSGEQ